VIEMPTTYQKADDDVTKLVADILKTNHPDLAETGVLFGVLMAENPEGDAVKHGGYPALACVKVVSAKDRVSKEYDVEMLIDLRAWEEMTDKHKAACVDHELEHGEASGGRGTGVEDGRPRAAEGPAQEG
jgi:hypothetical protein